MEFENFFPVLALLAGLCLGSFYNVCIHRYVTGQSIVLPGSHCPGCGHILSWWENISNKSINRVEEKYNWRLYAQRLLSFSRIYGFWKYVSNLERDETRRYLDMFYSLKMRSLSH